MVFGVRSEYEDLFHALITMGWCCVVVRTEHIASSVDAGVAESGLCVIVVVTELRRTAIAPWGAFNVSGVGWSGGSAVCMQRLWDGWAESGCGDEFVSGYVFVSIVEGWSSCSGVSC